MTSSSSRTLPPKKKINPIPLLQPKKKKKENIARTNWRSVGAQFQWTLINRSLDTDTDAGYTHTHTHTACHGYTRRVQHKYIETHPQLTHTHTHTVVCVGWASHFGWVEFRAKERREKMLNLIYRSAIRSVRNWLWLCKMLPHFPLLYTRNFANFLCIFRYIYFYNL